MKKTHENKMRIYLDSDYDVNNHIRNFLLYWMKPSRPRAKNDLDCLYLNGNLNADTIFSVWTPLKMVLEVLNPNRKFTKKDIADIYNNQNQYLNPDYSIVKNFNEFAKYAETKANTMKLPNRKMNNNRYCSFRDQMPPTLYNCFEGGKYCTYFDEKYPLNKWIEDEHLQFFFTNIDYSSKNNLIPIISGRLSDQIYYFHTLKEIEEMITNYTQILQARLDEID